MPSALNQGDTASGPVSGSQPSTRYKQKAAKAVPSTADTQKTMTSVRTLSRLAWRHT